MLVNQSVLVVFDGLCDVIRKKTVETDLNLLLSFRIFFRIRNQSVGLPFSNYSQLSQIMCLLRVQKHDTILLLFLYCKDTHLQSVCRSSASLLKQTLTEYIRHVASTTPDSSAASISLPFGQSDGHMSANVT